MAQTWGLGMESLNYGGFYSISLNLDVLIYLQWDLIMLLAYVIDMSCKLNKKYI